jgi:hypothetical protein
MDSCAAAEAIIGCAQRPIPNNAAATIVFLSALI